MSEDWALTCKACGEKIDPKNPKTDHFGFRCNPEYKPDTTKLKFPVEILVVDGDEE